MPLSNESVILLSPEGVSLIQILLLFSNFTLLAFVGFTLVGTAVAFLLPAYGGRAFQPFGLNLLSRVTTNLPVAVLVVIVAFISFYCAKLLYDPGLLNAAFWGGVLLILFFGMAVLALSRRIALSRGMISAGHALLAAIGILPVLAVMFVLICAAASLIMPEEWPFMDGNRALLLSWNGVAGFLEFIALSLALTGAGVLSMDARETNRLENPEDTRSSRPVGMSMAAAGLLIWPLPLVFSLLTLPRTALSPGVFSLAGVGLLLAMSACLRLLASSGQKESRRPAPVLVAALALFLVQALADHVARGNILIEPVLLARTLVVAPAQAGEVEEPALPGEKAAAAAGQKVFEKNCTPCHRFDRRLVGPPLREVVPKYRGDIETLKNFIRNPVKRNPDYPTMPKLPLTEEEIAAVADYLLQQTRSGNGG